MELTYESLKHGDKIKIEVVYDNGSIGERLKWVNAIVVIEEGFKFARLENGRLEMMLPHRMNYVTLTTPCQEK